ncbi:MarR family winged helix-turn-helix transcriptional regulator [Iamia sp. SCSIO 61187]|uniref:MarR family winged helix-turn-helix transcriptional regulator n=1 Tax=Iamia sp. SCSIO 61187 TaxID=2722752 RepID=UPI001C634C7A|nr:MarR family transcriptional regulator [Iamia sp. SCSIO 61187]
MSEPGAELPLLLLAGFRALIDDLHAQLSAEGHPDVRPTHGFALQAIGRGATSPGTLADALGVTKQAAARTVARLEQLGYVDRTADDRDGRRQVIVLTPAGHDCLVRSGRILGELRDRWIAEVGERRIAGLERTLGALLGPDGGAVRFDVPGWFAGS